VNPQVIAALRAHAAGLNPDRAGTELLISHGSILHRPDFTPFVHTSTGTGTTLIAWIDWTAALTALDNGQLPASGGERRILQLTASIAGGTPVRLRDVLPGLDDRNLDLLTAAIRHAAGGHHPPHH
jgi:hypothetical protein